MTRAMAVVLAVVLIAAGLAGCLGSSEEAAPGGAASEQTRLSGEEPSPASDAGDAAGEADGLARLAYPGAEPLRATEWANGTFTAHESCRPAGCTMDQAARYVELDDPLAAHAPTKLSAELTYDTGPRVFLDTIDLYVWSQDATFYNFDRTEEEGREAVQTTLLRGDEPVVLQVFYRRPTGAEPEVDYQLRIDVEVSPTTVPAGVPVAVEAEPGQRLLAERAADGQNSEEAGSPTLLAYGPDDAFLDRHEAVHDSIDVTLPEDTASGEHVFVPPEDSPPVELSTNGSGAEMRPLALSWDVGETRPVDGVEPVEWSFELAEVPLAVGLSYDVNRPMAVTAERGKATLAGPQGPLLEGELGCGFCLGNGFSWVTSTAIGADGLAPGSYEAVYEPTAEAGTQVGHFAVTYER